MQKYPIGRQDFKGIIEEGFLYIDKTPFINKLVSTHKYYFLSRPRRFGKSLLISTLEYLFKGKKELFQNLYIFDKWTFDEYPIIRISFSDIGYRTKGLSKAISDELECISEFYGVNLISDKENIANRFKELVQALFQKYNKQVVILIDEYDKPIIDYLDKDDIHIAKINRNVLKTFYSIIKDADQYLRLVFITGISKFSHVSIFSDLNNLFDISMNLDYNELCGISDYELKTYFGHELKNYEIKQIKEWYNGYTWHLSGNTVYNPFSILNFFSTGDFNNFWYNTATPTFLMELSKKEHFFKFDKIEVSLLDLQSFDFENLQLIPILFQTGYLTIVGENKLLRNIILSFPNQEVKEAYLQKLADTYIQSQVTPAKVLLSELLKALKLKDKEALKKVINSSFAHIPYSKWEKENENFYHAIIHLLFSLLGIYIHSEVQTHTGRADAILQIDGEIFCMEFKLNKSAEIAMRQIKNKGYLEINKQVGKPCHLIAINFNSKTRSVDDILWENE